MRLYCLGGRQSRFALLTNLEHLFYAVASLWLNLKPPRRKATQMHSGFREKGKAHRRSLTLLTLLLISGTAIGIFLALGFGRLIADACEGAPSCQRPLLALFGGIVMLHVFNIIAVFALVDHLNRMSEKRLLAALRR